MNESIVQQVKDALAPVADKLQQGAEFMYGVYYRQTLIEGVLQIVVPLLLIPVLFFLAKKWKAITVEGEAKADHYDKGTWRAFRWIVPTTATILWMTIGIPFMVNGATKVANPHFYTIDRIIQSVRAREVK
jgi:hypothetical protein